MFLYSFFKLAQMPERIVRLIRFRWEIPFWIYVMCLFCDLTLLVALGVVCFLDGLGLPSSWRSLSLQLVSILAWGCLWVLALPYLLDSLSDQALVLVHAQVWAAATIYGHVLQLGIWGLAGGSCLSSRLLKALRACEVLANDGHLLALTCCDIYCLLVYTSLH
eukprot:CAMPEP_0180542824 /NCGR_PEP_ID=MMETSP1036_2-20121128/68660_1 /TAXON_ID=632150 /ORGANISM="Azadinium spinosum, Strain 3D9" /LENGTH=162 /DNA_ID=CAMNT_0022557721 /DNA_START=21 /DNA_END=506 /DNA_ORIENTATION=+